MRKKSEKKALLATISIKGLDYKLSSRDGFLAIGTAFRIQN